MAFEEMNLCVVFPSFSTVKYSYCHGMSRLFFFSSPEVATLGGGKGGVAVWPWRGGGGAHEVFRVPPPSASFVRDPVWHRSLDHREQHTRESRSTSQALGRVGVLPSFWICNRSVHSGFEWTDLLSPSDFSPEAVAPVYPTIHSDRRHHPVASASTLKSRVCIC